MIDTQAIRKKVLDLAISGKLTEQFPEDGTAEELYREIQAEKQALIKAGKIKKEKPLPEITEDEIPFDVPESWKWCKIGSLITLVSGTDYKPEYYNDTNKGIPYITGASNLQEGGVLINRWTETPRNIANEGDVLLVCKGSGYGKVAMCDVEEAHIARQIMAVKKAELLEMQYILYFLNANFGYLKDNGQGLIPGVDRSTVLNILFPLPPLAEQKRIVEKIEQTFSVLDTIDALQAQYTDNLAALKSKLIDAAIQGKLTERRPEDGTAEELYQNLISEKERIIKTRSGRRDKDIKPVGNDTPFNLPENWKWIRLGDIGLFKKGPFGSALTKSIFVPKGISTVKVYEQQHAINKDNNLGRYYITREYFNEKMRGFEVCPGDIIVSCAGTIGETYIMPNEMEQGIINQALLRIVMVDSVDKRYFQYYFDAYLKQSANDQSNGSAIKNIPPFDVLKNWYFPLPPLAEQKRIVERLDKILAVCDEMR